MKKFNDAVEKHEKLILEAERFIWEHPETGYKEFETSAYMEDAFEKLKAISLQFFGFAYRAALVGLVSWASWNFFIVAGITSTAALIVLTAGVAAFSLYAFPQEAAVEVVSDIWSGIKDFVENIVNLFRGEDPSTPPPAETVEHSFVDDVEEENYTYVETPSIMV